MQKHESRLFGVEQPADIEQRGRFEIGSNILRRPHLRRGFPSARAGKYLNTAGCALIKPVGKNRKKP